MAQMSAPPSGSTFHAAAKEPAGLHEALLPGQLVQEVPRGWAQLLIGAALYDLACSFWRVQTA